MRKPRQQTVWKEYMVQQFFFMVLFYIVYAVVVADCSSTWCEATGVSDLAS